MLTISQKGCRICQDIMGASFQGPENDGPLDQWEVENESGCNWVQGFIRHT